MVEEPRWRKLQGRSLGAPSALLPHGILVVGLSGNPADPGEYLVAHFGETCTSLAWAIILTLLETERAPRMGDFPIWNWNSLGKLDSYPTQHQGSGFSASTSRECWLTPSKRFLNPAPKSLSIDSFAGCLWHHGPGATQLPHLPMSVCFFLSPLPIPLPTSPSPSNSPSHSPSPFSKPPFKLAVCASFCLWVFLLNTCFVIWHMCFQLYCVVSQSNDGSMHFSLLLVDPVSWVLSVCHTLC